MKLLRDIFAILMLCLACASCFSHRYAKCAGFELEEHLYDHIETEGHSYFEIAAKSVCDGDPYYIYLLSKTKGLDGFACYDHGLMLIKAIHVLSEERYIAEVMPKLTPKEQIKIYGDILTGFDVKYNGYYRLSEQLEKEFPLLYEYAKQHDIDYK